MAQTTVRWGVLSTAKIGLEAVIPAIQGSEFGEVVGLASRDGDAARAAAGKLGIARSYGSYESLLEDPEIDAVYNPLPNHLHAEWSMRAADAGKHVLCEKPIALSSAEAQQMVDHCAAAGVKLQEAFMYRFHPQWLKVHELVTTGHIGEVRAIQGWFSYFSDDPDNIRHVPEWGGGGLMDIGCYPISVARWLFDAEPEGVAGSLFIHPRYGVDVGAGGLLRFENGHATFGCGTQSEWGQRVFIEGTRGRIEVPIPFNPPNDRPTRIRVTSGGTPPEDVDTVVIEFPPADHYGLQADAFARAILDDEEVPTPPADAVANMRVIERVFASARGEGAPIA